MALAQEGNLALNRGAQAGAAAGQAEADGVVNLVVELHVREAVGEARGPDGLELAVYLRGGVVETIGHRDAQDLLAQVGIGEEAQRVAGLVFPAGEGDVHVIPAGQLEGLQ